MVSREEFDTFKKSLISEEEKGKFNDEIKKRKITMAIVFSVEAVLALLFIILSYTIWGGINNAGARVMIWFAVILVLFFTIIFFKVKSSKKMFSIKSNYMSKVLRFLIGDQFNGYSMGTGLQEADLKMSGFTSDFDDLRGSDLIDIDIPNDDGTRSGNSFRACDMYATKDSTDSEGNTTTTTVYSGAFAMAMFPTQFKCKIAVNSRLSGVKKIKLEDVSFNKQFQVFTDNQVEALCILTPSMMQKLVELKNRVRTLKISLFANRIYFGMPNINLFEISGSRLTDEIFDRVYYDVELLMSIVDEIKNNNKVFKI